MFLQIYLIFLKDHSGHGINIPRISSQRPARLAQACSNLRRDSWSLGETEEGIDFAENDVFLLHSLDPGKIRLETLMTMTEESMVYSVF